jgi:release factor glutamine methyltransferase
VSGTTKTAGPAATADARAALADGVAMLTAAGVPSAALTAELLLLHALGRDRAWLYAHPECPLNAQQRAEYSNLLDRRAAGAPTQYLTGKQEFWGLEFEVTPDVLIPRPETEHLVEVALKRLGEPRMRPLRIADVGTGSGCLAIALATELCGAMVVATDISPAALQVARRNAARHGVGERVEFLEMDLLSSFVPTALPSSSPALLAPGAQFDLIVCNPPYIGLEEAPQLQREVRDHEPAQALFAGRHGLDLYPPLISQAESLLGDGGTLVVELGHNGAENVRALLENEVWEDISVAPDLAGIPRVFSAQRAARQKV